jgi:inorganic triphosphatase YgiF
MCRIQGTSPGPGNERERQRKWRRRRALELKVELSKSDLERLRSELPISDLRVGAAGSKKLRTVFFDTPEHKLHAAGISLRLRRQNGGWVQTVKTDQKVAGGLSNPIELECSVEAEELDLAKISAKKIRRATQKAVQGTSLRPVFETVVHRTTRKIGTGDSDIEFALDEGKVRTRAGATDVAPLSGPVPLLPPSARRSCARKALPGQCSNPAAGRPDPHAR